MGLLNRMLNRFSSTETITNKSENETEKITKEWNSYQDTLLPKFKIIEELELGKKDKELLLKNLKNLLNQELRFIYDGKDKEEDLALNLKLIKRDKKIIAVHRLTECLDQAETKNEYHLELLYHLQTTLKSQKSLIKNLIKSKNIKLFKKTFDSLKLEIDVEKALIEKIGKITPFLNIFYRLSKAESLIKKLNRNEKRIINYMNKYLPEDGITDKWIREVYDAIGYHIYDIVAEGKDNIEDIEYKFIFSSEFESLVRNAIKGIRRKMPRDEIINAFIKAYRDDIIYK